MHVSVHESWNDEPPAPINRFGAWIGVADPDVLATGNDATLVDQKATILMTNERPVIVDVEMTGDSLGYEKWWPERAALLERQAAHLAHGEEDAFGSGRAVERERSTVAERRDRVAQGLANR